MTDRKEAYIQVIQELREALKWLIDVETQKLDAVQKNDLEKMERCMQKEQAAALQLRGAERKREQLQKEFGAEGKTFREMLLLLNEEDGELERLFQELKGQTRAFQSLNQSIQDLLQVNLHQIGKVLADRGEENSYTAKGKLGRKSSRLTDCRI